MNILIPIDFSESANHAAKYAIKHYAKATIYLLHIVSIRQAGSTMAVNINEDSQKLYQNKMAATKAELEKEFPSVKINTRVEIGLFAETIIEEVENCKIDLIVIDTDGASRLDEIILGSNAYLAIKNSPVPLLVIGRDHSLEPPKRILLASDFKGDLSDDTVRSILAFKNKFNVEMHVIHVNQSGNSDNIKLKINHLIDDEVNRFFVVNDKNIENAIIDFAQKENYDFIALAPKFHGIIRGLFHRSVTKRISANSHTALFILK